MITALPPLDVTGAELVRRATEAVAVWHPLGITPTGERLEAQRLADGRLTIKVSAFRGEYDTLALYVERWGPWFPEGWKLGRSGTTPVAFVGVYVESRPE